MDERGWEGSGASVEVTTAAEIVEAEQQYEAWVQDRRAEALLAARRALVSTSPIAGAGKADAEDLHSLAQWVMTGQDPWRPAVIEAPDDPYTMTWIDGRGMMPVEDNHLPDEPGPEYDPAQGDEGR
jgi:hypothetical protein